MERTILPHTSPLLSQRTNVSSLSRPCRTSSIPSP
jgi:hypothetical protein